MADKSIRFVDSDGNDVLVKVQDNGDGTYSQGSYDSATPTIYNVTLTNANTEYSQALPANTRKVAFRCRTANAIRYAWATGKVATPTAPYATLASGAEWAADGIKLTGKTLYFASPSAGVVVELEVWS